jgi:hypothetical protein
MKSLSFIRSVLSGHTIVMRSAVVGVSLMAAFAGCSPKNTSPAPVPTKALPPPPPPPSATSPTSATTGSLPQMLPGVDEAIPAWVGQQPNEPFAVRQFLESRKAPADNAASLYFAALAEVSSSMYLPNAPPAWPWNANNTPEQVRKLENTIEQLCDHDKLVQGAVPAAEIEAALAAAQPAIKKLDEAQQKPLCLFVTGLRIDSLFPHGQAARAFARLGSIRLYRARLKGSSDEAEQAIRHTLRLSRDLRLGGSFIIQLISITMDSMVLTDIADFTLTQPGLTAKDCDRVLALLTEHERDAVSCADEGIRVEYVTCRNTMDALQQKRMSPLVFGPNAERFLSQVNWPAEIDAINNAFASAIPLAAARYDAARLEQWAAAETAKAKTQNALITQQFLPAIAPCLGAAARHQAQLAGVECLAVVRRYALTHGSLPDNLDVAAREAGLKAVPTDPYSGGPMHYKVIGGKPVVYSVGKDGKDDGGTVDWEYGQKPGDFIFRIRE